MVRFTMFVVVLGLLASSAMAGGTRIGLAAGADYPFVLGNPYYINSALHARVLIDAPAFIRNHVPIEAVLSFSGIYPHRPFSEPVATNEQSSGLTSYPGRYLWFEPRYSAAATVRIYAVSRGQANHKPDGFEGGFGFGVHQFVSDVVEHHGGPSIDTQYDVQFRASAFVRLQLLPERLQGMFLEIEGERAIQDNHTGYLPIASIIATLGFRFHL